MTLRPPPSPAVQEDAVRAIRLARELSAGFREHRIRPDGLNATLLAATLRRLESGEIFDGRDAHTFECAAAHLNDLLPREMTGSKIVPIIIGSDDEGQECVCMSSVPTYTCRGEELAELQACLARFLELRERVIDAVAADAAVSALARR